MKIHIVLNNMQLESKTIENYINKASVSLNEEIAFLPVNSLGENSGVVKVVRILHSPAVDTKFYFLEEVSL